MTLVLVFVLVIGTRNVFLGLSFLSVVDDKSGSPHNTTDAILPETTTTTTTTTTMMTSTNGNASHHSYNSNNSSKSLEKVRKLLVPGQEETFDRTRPIYLDFGMSNGTDTSFYLSKGFSVVSVDAYKPWIDKAFKTFSIEIQKDHRLLLFNVGIALHEQELPMPLYYKKEGSVIASLDRNKGCQFIPQEDSRCKHVNVPVVPCDSILQLVGTSAHTMKVDIEMLHHACIRSLSRIESNLLPQRVCWEEHDKPFGTAETKIQRPITDVKLILGLYELGYDTIKIILQGPLAAEYYQISKDKAGFGQGSGNMLVDDMMHYRSHERTATLDGQFTTEWLSVHEVLMEGIFGPAIGKPDKFFKPGRTYYDICMKLSPDAKRLRNERQQADNFPLSSYALP